MDYNDFNENEQNKETYHNSYVLNGEPVYDAAASQEEKGKKRRGTKAIIYIVLAAIILIFKFLPIFDFGGTASDETDARGTIHYSQMEYVRPDVDGMIAKIDNVIAVCNTMSYDEIIPLLDDIYVDYWHVDTMYCLADVKSCADVTDEYYYNECLYLSNQFPVIDQKIEEMLFALAACPIASQLDTDYYGGDYLVYYTGETTYNDEFVALLQRESELILEYQTLMGAPTIEINGEVVEVETYLAEHTEDDTYYEAVELYYDKYGTPAAEIYVELVKVRHEIAYMCGYDSYIDYAYDNYSRDYDPDDVRQYISTVCLGVAPLYKEMYESGELTGYYMLGTMTSEENREALEKTCREIGGRVWSIFQYMDKNGLFDIEVSPNKVNMSFQTYFEDWQAPFVFVDAMGTTYDYLSFAHEFGHAVDVFVNYNSYITTDASESCSQAMEFLAAIYSSHLGSDSDAIKDMKMLDMVTLYTEQGAYNAFEEAIFAIPVDELTPERVRQTAHDVFLQYGLIFPEDDPMYDNMWIDIPHFFTNPFYIVSYIISNDASVQIYEMELEKPGTGVDAFVALCDRKWDLNYLENMEDIGLDASFSTERANAIVELIYSYFK